MSHHNHKTRPRRCTAFVLFVAHALVFTAAAHAAHEDPFVNTVAAIRPTVVAVGSYYFKDKPTVRYFGTGFVVHDGLTIATNAHVFNAVRDADREAQLRVFFPDSRDVQGRAAKLWIQDRTHDLALLRIEPPAAPAAPLAEPNTPVLQGQSVGVLGYPIGLRLGLVPAAHRGVIAAIVPAVLPLPRGSRLNKKLAQALAQPYDLYQLDMVVYPGNSGSPLFDPHNGRVIAVINKTLATSTREHLLDKPSGISYAVPTRWLRELIIRGNLSSGPIGTSTAGQNTNPRGD